MKKIVLLVLAATGLLTCSNNQSTSPGTSTVVPTILWKTSTKDGIPAGVDSVRITISSPSLASTLGKTFFYGDNQGTIPSVAAGISITIEIEGIDSLGHVLYSGSMTVPKVTAPAMDITIQANQVSPIAPSDLVAQSLSYNTIRLIWKENSTNETYYLISRQTGSSTTWDSIGFATQNTFTDTTLSPVTQYQYRITAVNGAGRSSATTAATATTLILDKTGPVLTVASFTKIDTVNARTVMLYGTAHDTSGVYQVMVNNVVAQLNGNQWIAQNFYLADTVDTIVIKATDNSIFKNATLDTITLIYKTTYVDTTNHAPVFTVSGDSMKATLRVGQTYKKILSAMDVDANDTVRFVVSSPLLLLGKDTVEWQPKTADTGAKACYALVYDKKQAKDSIGWTITVEDSAAPKTNHPPVFVTRLSQITDSVGQNRPYIDTLLANDQDVGQKLTFSVVTGPTGLAIGSSSGIVTWTPSATGTFAVSARVSDDSSASVDIAWTITVVSALNHPPKFVTQSTDMAAVDTVGNLYKGTLLATDPDGDSIRYSILSAPAELSIGSKTGLLVWTPAPGDTGNKSLSVMAGDGKGGFDTLKWVVKVVKKSYGLAVGGMRLLNGDTYQMGQAGIAEPTHPVTVSSFYIDTTLVTQVDYQGLMSVNPSQFTGDTRRPVENVTWFDAVLYCNKRSKADGKDTVYSFTNIIGPAGNGCTGLTGIKINYSRNGYRLPTESEWEYACRAGTTTAYYWGADTNGINNFAWWVGNSNGTTHPVATKTPNAWGLYDMTGNLWEHCNDLYAGVDTTVRTNPIGPATGTAYVLRGGPWAEAPVHLYSSYRTYLNIGDHNNSDGFRCARSATAVVLPTAPTISSAVAGDGKISVSWSPVSGATSYNLYYAAAAIVTVAGTKVTGVTSPYVLGSLTDGTQYAVGMTAVNAAGESGLSSVQTATPQTVGSTVTDIDGNVYQTVTIGTQVWMVENLKTTRFNDGNPIPLVTANSWAALLTPGYCWYDDSASYGITYGALYNWYAVNTGNLAPTGWHAPTDSEWTVLTTYLGGLTVAGGKLKETGSSHWISPNLGATNETGFSALPGGFHNSDGTFSAIEGNGYWWSSTASSGSNAWDRDLNYSSAGVYPHEYNRGHGFSVRCIKGNPVPTAPSIITQPKSDTLAVGQNDTFSVVVTGTAPLVYQWYKNNAAILGATSSSYSIANVQAADAGTYTVTVSNGTLPNATSTGAILTLNSTTVSVTDTDGNVYQTVTIGTQVWMAQNLKTTRYNDGSAIQLVTDGTTWSNLTTPAYCWYNDSIIYGNIYGALYNWYTVNTGKLAPTGWHVPTDSEWTVLITYLGGDAVAGGLLKETGTAHWASPNAGATNTFGFFALPGGERINDGTFDYVGGTGVWWSSTASGAAISLYRSISYNAADVGHNSFSNVFGFSVRCIKN
jgi:uncharacterized protein (TIGR02145 family)